MMHAVALGVPQPEYGSGVEFIPSARQKECLALNMIRQGLPLMTVHLHTKWAKWSVDAIPALVMALRWNDTFKSVLLEDDTRLLGDSAVGALAEMLLHNTSLLKLVLRNVTRFTPTVFGALCGALSRNPDSVITEIDFRGSNVGQHGAVALAQACALRPHSLMECALRECIPS
jgi:hypothetical protein